MGDTNIRDEYLNILNSRGLWFSAIIWLALAGFAYYLSWIYQPDEINLSFGSLFLILSISTIGIITTLFGVIILIFYKLDDEFDERSFFLITLVSLTVPLIVNLIFRSINEINDIISDYYSSWDLVGLFSLQLVLFVLSLAMFFKIEDVDLEWYETPFTMIMVSLFTVFVFTANSLPIIILAKILSSGFISTIINFILFSLLGISVIISMVLVLYIINLMIYQISNYIIIKIRDNKNQKQKKIEEDRRIEQEKIRLEQKQIDDEEQRLIYEEMRIRRRKEIEEEDRQREQRKVRREIEEEKEKKRIEELDNLERKRFIEFSNTLENDPTIEIEINKFINAVFLKMHEKIRITDRDEFSNKYLSLKNRTTEEYGLIREIRVRLEDNTKFITFLKKFYGVSDDINRMIELKIMEMSEPYLDLLLKKIHEFERLTGRNRQVQSALEILEEKRKQELELYAETSISQRDIDKRRDGLKNLYFQDFYADVYRKLENKEGKEVRFTSLCGICKKIINDMSQILICPHCESVFHRKEILETVKVSGKCPHCKINLKITDKAELIVKDN